MVFSDRLVALRADNTFPARVTSAIEAVVNSRMSSFLNISNLFQARKTLGLGNAAVYKFARVGEWAITPCATVTSNRIANGTARFTFIPCLPGVYTAVRFHTWDSGTAGAMAKVVILADNDGDLSNNVLYDSPQQDITVAAGAKTISGLNIVVPNDTYGVWAAVIPQGSPTTTSNLATVGPFNPLDAFDVAGVPAYVLGMCWQVTGITGALPSSFLSRTRAEGFPARVAMLRGS